MKKVIILGMLLTGIASPWNKRGIIQSNGNEIWTLQITPLPLFSCNNEIEVKDKDTKTHFKNAGQMP